MSDIECICITAVLDNWKQNIETSQTTYVKDINIEMKLKTKLKDATDNCSRISRDFRQQKNIGVYEKIPPQFVNLPRMRYSCAKNMYGAWTNVTQYWYTKKDKKSLNAEKNVFYLNGVCWLDIRFTNEIEIPNGTWACFWRVKLQNLRWKGNWKVGITIQSFDQSVPNEDEKYTKNTNTIHYSHKQDKGILREWCGKGFFYIYFGIIK
eukprot:242923_1